MINFVLHKWDDALFSLLKNSLRGDGRILKTQCENGRAQAIHISDGEGIDLWSIMRREQKDGYAELVICCIEGKGLRKAAPVIEKWAADNGHETIRFHTQHKGLHKLLNNFEVQEVVYSKRLVNE